VRCGAENEQQGETEWCAADARHGEPFLVGEAGILNRLGHHEPENEDECDEGRHVRSGPGEEVAP
jgi:hypothetical protein